MHPRLIFLVPCSSSLPLRLMSLPNCVLLGKLLFYNSSCSKHDLWSPFICLQPTEQQELKYLRRLEDLKLTNQKHLPDLGDDNIEKIMYKIKCRVMKERMRLSEFCKDYDKLRTGRILKTVFPRAMDLASLKLTKVEVEQLMNRYCAELFLI